jgi:hypothetical protein
MDGSADRTLAEFMRIRGRGRMFLLAMKESSWFGTSANTACASASPLCLKFLNGTNFAA